MSDLSCYTRELLADVSEAKRAGGVAMLHVTSSDRVKRGDVSRTIAQLLAFGVYATETGAGLLLEWGGRGSSRMAGLILGKAKPESAVLA